jgi:hypothetical protein
MLLQHFAIAKHAVALANPVAPVLDPQDQRPGPKIESLYALDYIFDTNYMSVRLPHGVATFSKDFAPDHLVALATQWLHTGGSLDPARWVAAL